MVIVAGMSANVWLESHLRELLDKDSRWRIHPSGHDQLRMSGRLTVKSQIPTATRAEPSTS